MQTVQLQSLDLMSFSQVGVDDNIVDAAWPVYRDTGATGLAAVYFELAPGMRLPRHTDSAEELLVLLEGEVEALVGAARRRLQAGGLAVVPAMVPHGLENVGAGTARVLGVFPANTIVSTFGVAFEQTGDCVVGTPPPAAGAAITVS